MSGYQLHSVIINVARVKHMYLLDEANTKLGGDVYMYIYNFIAKQETMTGCANYNK